MSVAKHSYLNHARRDATLQERSKPEQEDREGTDSLTDLIRTGAQQLLAQALTAEGAALLATDAAQRAEQGHARVVLNGHHPQRDIQPGIGPVPVQVPNVRSCPSKPGTVRSALGSPYVRKTASVEPALPWLSWKGISTGEMPPALEALVGPEAKGLSASTVARLKQAWREEYMNWRQGRLDANQWVSIWGAGIDRGGRAEPQRLCAWALMGMGRNSYQS